MCCSRLVAGIFSREDPGTYDWLITILTDTTGVGDVRPVLITNNWADFSSHVPKCSIAILYHSKKRGRLNLTNVADSLYDNELQYLCKQFGRDKVLVVIGDVEDSSDAEKDRILHNQPDIHIMARELFLFNEIKGKRTPFQGDTKRRFQKVVRSVALTVHFMKSVKWLICGVIVIVIVAVVVYVGVHHDPQNPTAWPPTANVNQLAPNTTQLLRIVNDRSGDSILANDTLHDGG